MVTREKSTTWSRTLAGARVAALVLAAVAVAAADSALARDERPAHADAAAAVGAPIAAAASASRAAVRTDLGDRIGRPEVYLALHGNEGLLGATDSRWSFVRAHLDGLWGNPFELSRGFDDSVSKSIALIRKVATRRLVVEHSIAAGGGCRAFVGDRYFREIEQRSGNISFDREGVALYAGENPNCWGVNGGVAAARQFYGRFGYDDVYALYQPQNLGNRVNAAAFPTIVPGSSGDTALRTSDGVVIECPTDACTNPVFGAPVLDGVRQARARGQSFTWFTGYSRSYGLGSTGWLSTVQRTYNLIADTVGWREGDAVVVINYDGYRALPERNANGTPADTTTGIVAWLLEQRPIPLGRG